MFDIEKEYDSIFSWRSERYIHNFEELLNECKIEFAYPLKIFSNLIKTGESNACLKALAMNIIYLIYEANECYILGEFQSCILTCGAVVERVLKLEYEKVKGALPKGNWTLGKCINRLDWKGTSITNEILENAKKLIEPKNSQAHGLLEHSDPILAFIGGKNRGIESGDGKYLIEPYRGEALECIKSTYSILHTLY